MVFSSLFFVFVFLPLNLISYFLIRSQKAKNYIMLIFSLIFYAWGEPIAVFLMVGMALADYLIARGIYAVGARTKIAKTGLILACLIDLGLLGLFKYATFFVGQFQNVFGVPENIVNIVLPIGISFYTFQLLSYVVDVYRGEVEAQKSFPTLLMYVSLFHQCIAGPIVRYSDVNKELTSRKVTITDLSYGITRFTVGLAKKAVLANTCGSIADTLLVADSVAPAEALTIIASRPTLSLWVGCLAYMFQIYLDFSAYSDMAIGMGRMIGFHYLENFNYPYIANSVTDFWRRWHMSLSSFFRDYVYIPLGGNRCSTGRQIFNLLVVWALTGFWHGASWNYMLWGLYYFVFLVLEKFVLKRALEKIPVISNAVTLVIVYFGWVLFKFTDFKVLGAALRGIFGNTTAGFTNFETSTSVGTNVLFLIICAIACTPIVPFLSKLVNKKYEGSSKARAVFAIATIATPVICLLLATIFLVGDSYNPFLYWKF